MGDYRRTLSELAASASHIDRSYLFQEDDLYEMESELAASDQRSGFYDLLLDQSREHTDSLNGANFNWLLDKL